MRSRIGWPPTSTSGFGQVSVSGARRLPLPAASTIAADGIQEARFLRPGSSVAERLVMGGDSSVAFHRGWRSIGDGVSSGEVRSEEHTSELQSLMRISYAVFCLKTK